MDIRAIACITHEPDEILDNTNIANHGRNARMQDVLFLLLAHKDDEGLSEVHPVEVSDTQLRILNSNWTYSWSLPVSFAMIRGPLIRRWNLEMQEAWEISRLW